jgi:hypothetical protein
MMMAGSSFFGRKSHKVGFNFDEPSEVPVAFGAG